MARITTIQEAEEAAEKIAKLLGYELRQWNNRWHWRKISWRAGVWYAGDYPTKLAAIDGIVQQLGK